MKKLMLFVIVLSGVFLLGCTNQVNDDPNLNIEEISKCLGDKGVKMYGTETCSHCLDQKAMFGDSFKYIEYVDCAQDRNVCSKLKGTPTWELANGELLEGVQNISTLAEKAGCK
ncbi:hypothetical protein K9M48_02255 [Candidatus Gracilibacteria bacterium]|nr:hypothetical protein [Candidatus Gracilibacteria bacterium]